jgi:hypothetical protein
VPPSANAEVESPARAAMATSAARRVDASFMGRLRGLFFKEGSNQTGRIYPIDHGGNMMERP